MPIASISAIDTEQQILERLAAERAQREQVRLAQLQADAEVERVKLQQVQEQQRLTRQRATVEAERLRLQSQLDTRVTAEQDALRRQDEQLAEARVQGTVREDERLRSAAGPNAYRTQSTPPAASSITDQLA